MPIFLILTVLVLASCASDDKRLDQVYRKRECQYGENSERDNCRPSNASQAHSNLADLAADTPFADDVKVCPSVAQETVSKCRAEHDCKSHRFEPNGAAVKADDPQSFKKCVEAHMTRQRDRTGSATSPQ